MYDNLKKRDLKRKKRTMRVRKKIRGTAETPRLSVYKSNKNLSLQLIDDNAGVTLAATSTLMSKDLKGKNQKDKAAAKKLGEEIAKKAKDASVSKMIFDRGYHKYHGVIDEMLTAVRENGIQV